MTGSSRVGCGKYDTPVKNSSSRFGSFKRVMGRSVKAGGAGMGSVYAA
jgi:hypothetical protein